MHKGNVEVKLHTYGYLYEISMNGDLHSVTLLVGNVCNVDHITGCLTYCLHEGKDKMSPVVPDRKRKDSYPVHYHILHSEKCCMS